MFSLQLKLSEPAVEEEKKKINFTSYSYNHKWVNVVLTDQLDIIFSKPKTAVFR